MTRWCETPIRTAADVAAFETELPLEARLTERSVYDVFDGGSRRAPDDVALTMLMTGADDEQPRRVTYAQLAGLVRQAANAFHTLAGPRPGVAYLLPSLVETHAVLWGAQTSGYAVPLNFLLQPAHLAELVRAADARVLVALGPHPALDIWEKATAVRDLVPGLELVAVTLPGAAPPPDALDLAALLGSQPEDRLVFGDPGRDDELAAYLHTGGTTGDPKLVTLTHRSQLVAALGGALLGDMNPGDVLSATLPLFHAGGTVFCALSPLMAGAELLIMSPAALRDATVVANFWRLCARHGVTMAGAVPTGLAAVIDVPVDGADLSKLRIGFTGASSIPGSVIDRFEAMAGVRLAQVYGMTESSGLLAIDPVAGPGARGSVGVALPFLELKVLRQDGEGSGGECEAGEIGLIVATGAPVSPGYRNRAHDGGTLRDGTLDTGDLGYRDPDGNLFIAGRAKDLIIRGGHNIDPLMIEEAMSAHPAVTMAAAVGEPDGYAGEVPVVYVSLRADAQVSTEELHEHARRTIAERPAWPRQIHVLDAIPLTSVGKIFKPDLRCDAARRVVEALLAEGLGTTPDVAAHSGGPRGMRVEVTLAESATEHDVAQVGRLLAPFLFESVVHAAEPSPPAPAGGDVAISDWLQQGPSDAREVADRYDEWAARYDDDLAAWSYRAPDVVAEIVVAGHPTAGSALDVGCGTGLVGQALRARGFTGRLLGLDLSPASLDVARRSGAYDALDVADLQQPLALDDAAVDAVVCVGVMTYLPDVERVWRELARVTRPQGLVVATLREDLWHDRHCQDVVDRLAAEGVWTAEVTGPAPYLPEGYGEGPAVACYYLTARVT